MCVCVCVSYVCCVSVLSAVRGRQDRRPHHGVSFQNIEVEQQMSRLWAEKNGDPSE